MESSIAEKKRAAKTWAGYMAFKNWEGECFIDPATRTAPRPTPGQCIRAIAVATNHSSYPADIRRVYKAAPYEINMSRPQFATYDGRGGAVIGYERLDNAKIQTLIDRYRRFCRWMEEDRHQWEYVTTTHYMDNSIEVTERSRLTGQTRNRMTLGPGGDACF